MATCRPKTELYELMSALNNVHPNFINVSLRDNYSYIRVSVFFEFQIEEIQFITNASKNSLQSL